MKINILLPNFAMRPSGGHRIAYQYANGLAEKGHQINLIFSSGKQNTFFNRLLFFAMYITIHFSKKWFKFNTIIKRKYVFNLAENRIPNADATIATACVTALALEKYAATKGKKFYLIQHYETWLMPKEIVDETWGYNDMIKIVISKWLWNIGKALGASNMFYVPNFIDERLFEKKIKKVNRQYDVSMIFSQEKTKGSQYGILALELVKKQFEGFSAVLFGSCPRDKKIPKWIDYVENPNQEFLANSIYNNSKIYLCSSISEGWGLPPMEAMACGAAVVTTRNGGVDDFCIDEETALMCDVKNTEQMCEKIMQLLTDTILYDRLVEQGLKKIEEFSFSKSLNKLEEILENLSIV
ncbi:MAG: glycosyltransferase family 4 protein [Fibromonadaceae bacterium]|nr:glycosyltransferase family 4 protein [Fibromonadaceae bacterium]